MNPENILETLNTNECNHSRRDFLKQSALAVAVISVTGATVLTNTAQADRNPYQPVSRGMIDLGAVSGFKVGSIVDKTSTAGVFISRTNDGLIALSSLCTHEGCSVGLQANSFQCPCHRAEYSNTGDFTRRPANEPLPHYPLTIKKGHLMVDTNKLIRRTSVAKTDFLKVKYS